MKTSRRINSADQEIGRKVRLRRLQQDVSQTTLGEALGVTFQQIQKYEKGSNRISAGRLQKIAAVLEVPVTFFFEPVGGLLDGGRKLEFLDNAMALRLLEAFDKVKDPKKQRAILALVEQMGARVSKSEQE